MGGKTYEGRFLREISFPLGGIGAGSIGLAGNGRLIDREIFNRPNRQSVNGYTNFAIKAERDGEVLDAIQGNIAVLKSYTCMRLRKENFTPSSTPQRSICLCTLRRTRRSNYSAKKGGLREWRWRTKVPPT